MKIRLIFVVLVVFVFQSCNYSFLVNKRNIVHNEKGYLVFRQEGAIFFPYSDTADTRFLADKYTKVGYKIDYDTYWLDSLAKDYRQLLFIKNDRRFSIIPVEVKYFLSDSWLKEDEQNAIEYKWKDETKVLRFKQHDWRYIVGIYLVRKTDKERAKELNIDWGPSHYR